MNNAGVYEFGPIEAVTPEHFHKQFNLNVLGLLLTTQAAVAQFNPKGGSIINIGSVVAPDGLPKWLRSIAQPRARSDSITVSLSKELGPKEFASMRSTPA